MAAIIACYSVYAHYHQRVGMYVCEPARVGACMYGEGGFRCFLLFRTAFCGPIDCGPAVRVRIGWISCRVTFREWFVIALTYHCLCLEDRRGQFGRSYHCSSFGGRCAYIHELFRRILSTCGVWSAYGSFIACSWIERLYVWGARFSSLTVFSVPVSLWNPRAGSRSGRPCMLASIAVPRGGAWSASHPWSPDLTWPVLSVVHAVCADSRTITTPRHRPPYVTLPYPDRTNRTLPAYPCTMPILLCVSLTWPISLCLYLSVFVASLDCIAPCSRLWL